MRRALVAVVLLAALAVPAVASAHATAVRTSPTYKQRFDRPPTRVEIEFNQRITLIPNAIRVYDEQGRIVSRPAVLSPDRKIMSAELLPLARGAYTVRWQSLSADSHIGSGVYTFGVRVDPPDPAEAYGASGPTTFENVVRWFTFLGLALVIGTLTFRLAVLRGPLGRRYRSWLYGTLLVGNVIVLEAGIAAFLLRAQDALQLPMARFLYGDLSPMASTRFGYAFVAMTLGFAAITSLVFFAWLTDRERVFLPASLGLAVLFASGLSLSGHSAVDRGASKGSEIADWIHLVGACAWAGGILQLVVVFLVAREDARRAFARFAQLAPLAMVPLLGAGIYLSILRLTAPSDLVETRYGVILLIKLCLVVLALAWAGFHHFVLRPRLDRPAAVGRARGSLAGEGAVGVAILLLAAFLVNAAPPEPARTPVSAAPPAASR